MTATRQLFSKKWIFTRGAMEFMRTCYSPKPHFFCFAQSFDHSLVSVWKWGVGTNLNVSIKSCAKQQIKITACLKKGSLLNFPLNCTGTSDCCVQKLGNSDNLWHDFEWITVKVCSQISSKWKVMFESKLETCINSVLTGQAPIFESIFSAICYWKQSWTVPLTSHQ